MLASLLMLLVVGTLWCVVYVSMPVPPLDYVICGLRLLLMAYEM